MMIMMRNGLRKAGCEAVSEGYTLFLTDVMPTHGNKQEGSARRVSVGSRRRAVTVSLGSPGRVSHGWCRIDCFECRAASRVQAQAQCADHARQEQREISSQRLAGKRVLRSSRDQ